MAKKFIIIFIILLSGFVNFNFVNAQVSPLNLFNLDVNTVALWRFNNLFGSVVTDETGTNNGVAIGTSIVDGKFGKARYFNGVSDYIVVPHFSNLTNFSQLTIEVWIYPTGFDLGCWNQNESIVFKGVETPPAIIDYALRIDRNVDTSCGSATSFRQLKFSGEFDGTNIASSIWHEPNQWYYVVFTYDGSYLKLYVNGNLEAISDYVPNLAAFTTYPVYINHHTWNYEYSSSQRIQGLIDEIRISKIARSAEEILNNYNKATIPEKAAELAKFVINGPYLGDGDTFGGKGWDIIRKEYVTANLILSGYNFWNNKLKKIDFGVGLDCSGLTQWAYNYSFDSRKSLLQNAIRYDSADGQYKNNTETIVEVDLRPGDLLFLDKDSDNRMDHVAMYTGDFVINGDTYDIVEAFSPHDGIISSNISKFKARPGFDLNKHIRRVIVAPLIGGQVKAGSPIDLIVTDPDDFTITPTTAIQTEEEYLRGIPGELYYTENVLGADGRPEDIIYWPEQKIGDYIIKVLPETGASSTETYSLEFTAGEQTIILADDIPLSQIPSEGYGVNVASGGAINTFVPVSIDIKPNSYPNSINLESNGTTPVAIFGSNTLDVYQINLNSITLAGAPIKIKNNGQLMAGYKDVNGDSFTDIVIHIITEALQLTSTDTKAELNGFLFDGRKVKGSDSVRIVP